jgi:hypothetical protein
MSNNYCKSSSKLLIPADKMDKAKEIVVRVTNEIEQDEDGYCGTNIDFEKDGIWFHHDESINPDHVATIAQALLDGLDIEEPFVFSWAYTCSKARLNEFGGGACALKRGCEQFWVDAMSLAEKHFKNK